MNECYQCGTGKPEEWREVLGFPGYHVSDHGRVRNTRTDRILRDGSATKRYARVSLRRDGGSWPLLVHPLVLEAFTGPRPNKQHGLHADDDGRHNHLGNLRWGTPTENAADRIRNGSHWNICPWGHQLIPGNCTQASLRRGTRSCLACTRARSITRNAATHGVTLDHQTISDRYYADILAGIAHPHARDRTHCPYDHALTAPNIIAAFGHAGRRGCLACHRARGYVAYHPEADLRTEADRYYTKIMAAGDPNVPLSEGA